MALTGQRNSWPSQRRQLCREYQELKFVHVRFPEMPGNAPAQVLEADGCSSLDEFDWDFACFREEGESLACGSVCLDCKVTCGAMSPAI